MDKKLTDNEIVKALECCNHIETDCELCPLYTTKECSKVMLDSTLDLINRLQEKDETRHKVFETKCEELEIAKAENERLKEEKSKLENKIDEIYPLVMQLPNAMQQAKAEAYKEVLQKVHIARNQSLINKTAANKIEKILKELVGEGKCRRK